MQPSREPIRCPGLHDGLALVGAAGTRAIWSADAAGTEKIGGLHGGRPTVAGRGPDGTMWAEAPRAVTRGADSKIVRIKPNGRRKIRAVGQVSLSHVGVIDGTTAAVYLDRTLREDPYPDLWGHVYVEPSTGPAVSIGPAEGLEYVVGSAAGAGEAIAVSAWRPAGFQVEYRSPDGQPIEGFYDPNDDTARAAVRPKLSPDTEQLAWVEAREDGGEHGDGGDSVYRITVAASADGSDPLWSEFPVDTDHHLAHADFDGRYWVGTFATVPEGHVDVFEPQRIVVVDFEDWILEPNDVCVDTPFIASIDRYEAPR